MTTPQPGSLPQPALRPIRIWDVVLTIVLLVGLGALAWIMSLLGAFFAMASDSCFDDCDTGLIQIGMLLAMGLPWVVLIAAAVVAVVLLVKRRLAFWIPLAAAPVVIGCWYLGGLIAQAGAG